MGKTKSPMMDDINTVICLCEAELQTRSEIGRKDGDPEIHEEVERLYQSFNRIRPLIETAPTMVVAIKKAIMAISQDWTRCDDETGNECRGENCTVGAHRAIAFLEHALRKGKAQGGK